MLKPALLFQDHMILQRNKQIMIWGTADQNASVSVTVQGQTASSCASADGQWSVEIGPLQVSFSETMTITSGEDTVELRDIQVGDVWLAGGQSNMEFYMRYDADVGTETEVCANENIRFFDYPEVSYPGQIDEADYGKNFGFWRKASAENLQWFSAVAYYFAKEIQQKHKIPVGILGCNWGGTLACCWMDEQSVCEGGGQIYLDEYHEAIRDMDLNAYDERFRQNRASWRIDPFADPFSDLTMQGMGIIDILQKLYGHVPDLSKMDFSAWAPPMGPKHEWRPCGVYESMLCQVAPYGIRGILFYQGESDGDQHPELYATLFPALIQGFRSLWKEVLPFLFVQLAPFGQWMQSVGEPYAMIRAAQQLTAETVPNTGMAVISDVGMEFDIHPKKKKPVGQRLALLADKIVYGEDILCEAPTMISAKVADGNLLLRFENTGTGLWLANHTPDGVQTDSIRLGGLQIFSNGEPTEMKDITAEVIGDTVTLRGVCFKAPVTVELGCGGWYRINLYNSAGIPARPVRITVE